MPPDKSLTILELRNPAALDLPEIVGVFAGQRLGIREVDDGIWLVTFITHDLGYIDLEQKTLQTIDNPFGSRFSPMS